MGGTQIWGETHIPATPVPSTNTLHKHIAQTAITSQPVNWKKVALSLPRLRALTLGRITDYNAAVGSVSPGQDVSPGWMAYRYRLIIITSLYLWKFHSFCCLLNQEACCSPPLFSKPVAPPPLQHTPAQH